MFTLSTCKGSDIFLSYSQMQINIFRLSFFGGDFIFTPPAFHIIYSFSAKDISFLFNFSYLITWKICLVNDKLHSNYLMLSMLFFKAFFNNIFIYLFYN